MKLLILLSVFGICLLLISACVLLLLIVDNYCMALELVFHLVVDWHIHGDACVDGSSIEIEVMVNWFGGRRFLMLLGLPIGLM